MTSVFESNSRHVREVLIFCFKLKKTAAEVHRMLSSTYGEAALSEITYRDWSQRFKSGDFDVEDRHGGEKKNFKRFRIRGIICWRIVPNARSIGKSLEVTQQAISKYLRAMGTNQKLGNWVLYQLKRRNIERRFFACEQLL